MVLSGNTAGCATFMQCLQQGSMGRLHTWRFLYASIWAASTMLSVIFLLRLLISLMVTSICLFMNLSLVVCNRHTADVSNSEANSAL